MRKLLYILTAAALWWPSAAAAQTHKHHSPRHRHLVRMASVERTYWPIFEEWLTPAEGAEVEADVCAQLNELAKAGVAESC